MKRRTITLGILTTFFLQTSAAFADANGDMFAMLESMKKQLAQMQSTIDQQNLRIQQLESRTVLEQPKPAVPIGPQGAQAYLTESDWQKGIKDNIGQAISWLKGAKFGGDFRLRYEAFDTYDKNNDAGSTGMAADRSRNRFRMRLRWGFEKDYGDDWKFGFRLATSGNNNTDPNSTNVTLGNPGYFTYKPIWVDRAYVSYEPNGLKDYGLLKSVKIAAGKFDNPFLRYSTPILWDGDVTPEGIAEQANIQLLGTEDNQLNLYATAGQFIVNENAAVESDATIYGTQGALTLSTYAFRTDQPVDFTGAVSFYDYTNWFQTVLAANNTASTSYLRTNSIVADDFRVLDIYPELVFYVNRLPVTLWGDYAVNLANVGTEDIVRSAGADIHDSDDAFGFGLKIGKTKKKGSWEAFWGYYEIGANSVVAAFNDGDFGGPGTAGFTNRRGHKFGIGYQLTENLVLNWTGYLVEPLNPFDGNATLGLQNAANERVFRSQLDANYKF